jgi:adenosylhomocysteine nucleosidase
MRIGIIGAMDSEIALLKEKAHVEKTETFAGMEFNTGRIGDIETVICRSGIGKVAAALCVQILADRYNVTHIINTGIAGSLNDSLRIGDIVVSSEALYHDADAVYFGYPIGVMPGTGTLTFRADEQMAERAMNILQKEDPSIQVIRGRITTGDQFIAEKKRKEWIRETFQGDCTEMEGCAIAHACTLNQIPFVIIRAISDQADDDAGVTYEEFENHSANICAGLVFEMVRSMGQEA